MSCCKDDMTPERKESLRRFGGDCGCNSTQEVLRGVDHLGIPRGMLTGVGGTSDEEFSKKLQENNQQMTNSIVNEKHGNPIKPFVSKSSTLRIFYPSPETDMRMQECAERYRQLGQYLASLGNSRELSEAFTCLETSMQYALKHFCVTDPEAIQDELFA